MIREHAHSLRLRRPVDPLIPSEVTNILGEAHLRSTIALMGWRSVSGLDMDYQKVDCTCRLGNAIIDIQLRTRNLSKRDENWNWLILKDKDRKQELEFYDKPYTFLCLVGIKVMPCGNGTFHQETIQDKIPQIALIPGKVVFEYFTETAPESQTLGLSLKKLVDQEYDDWNKYFGEEHIRRTLSDTSEKQEEEEELLKEHRKKQKKT